MHERARDALLGWWGRTVAARPAVSAGICLLLAAACVVLTAQKLEFQADRSDLIDRDLPWNRLYTAYKAHFARWDDLIVCLEGRSDDTRADV